MTALKETPQHAARRFAQPIIEKGFTPQALHAYTDEKGAILYWRIRAKNLATGEKWIRPLSINGTGYVLKEPEFDKNKGKPLYNLFYIYKYPKATLWITEGEWASDHLNRFFRQLGVFGKHVAVTSGGAASARVADWSPAHDRKTPIWPDNAPDGLAYGREVAEILRKLSCEAKQIDVSKLDLPKKGDCVDWLEQNPNALMADLLSLTTLSEASGTRSELKWPEEIPLQRKLPPSPPFPLDALGPLAPIAETMSDIIQAPMGICAQSVLAGASLAVQPYADLEIDGRVTPVSEFFLTVGVSGERKSAADKVALKPHREYQHKLSIEYEKQLQQFRLEEKAYNKERDQRLNRGKSLEAKKRELQDLGDPPVRPLVPIILCPEPTYEGLIRLFKEGHSSLGLFSDEGGRLIGGHGMKEDNILKTAAGLSGLWDGGEIARIRAGDEPFLLFGRRLSFHLMIQPGVAQQMLYNPVLLDQGILSRCLTSWPSSTMGSRFYKEVNITETSAFRDYDEQMRGIFEEGESTRDFKISGGEETSGEAG